MASYKPYTEFTYPVYKISDNLWYDTRDDGTVLSQDPRTGHSTVLDYCRNRETTLVERRLSFLRDKEQYAGVHPIFSKGLTELSKTYKTRMDHLMYGPSGKYIDSKGKVFHWAKSKYFTLQYYKIKRVRESSMPGVMLIELIGIDKVITTRYLPPKGYPYAALLILEGGALLYGYSTTKGVKRRSSM